MTDEITTIVPAAPGFDVVSLMHNPYEFDYMPIIAWRIECDEDGDLMHAIALETCVWCAIRCPNGTITFEYGNARFAKGKESEALQYAIKQREEEIAYELKKKEAFVVRALAAASKPAEHN